MLPHLHCSTGVEVRLWKTFLTPRLVQRWNALLSGAVLSFTIGNFEKELQEQLIPILLIILLFWGRFEKNTDLTGFNILLAVQGGQHRDKF